MSLREKVERIKRLHQKINEDVPITLEELSEEEKLADELWSYQCPYCFEYILEGKEGKDFIVRNKRRWHLACYRKLQRELMKLCKAC